MNTNFTTDTAEVFTFVYTYQNKHNDFVEGSVCIEAGTTLEALDLLVKYLKSTQFSECKGSIGLGTIGIKTITKVSKE